jgi:hypothetical protein
MIANVSDSPRNIKRRLRRRITECREAAASLRDEALVADRSERAELRRLATETAALADWAESILQGE